MVTFAGLETSTWGNVIIVKYSTNMPIWSRYAHVESVQVVKNQVVKQGQSLGYVGNANNQFPFHLHFDTTLTNIIEQFPGHWPGENLTALKQNYVEPRGLILASQKGFTNTPKVVISSANFRAGPSTSYRVYEILQTGKQVTVLGLVDDYNLVKVDNTYGFIHNSLLGDITPTGIDMFPYIQGDGRLYEVKNEWGSQQRHQSQTGQNNEIFQTKDSDWEQMFITNDYIIRDIDTSPGGDRYYRLKEGSVWGSAWIPRKWSVGDSFTRARFVQFFKVVGGNCIPDPINSGNVTDTMRFVAKHNTYTFKTGFTLPDVIELEWINGPERYFYAINYGLVGWERLHDDPNTPKWSAISEEHAPGTRPDNLRKVINCI